MFHLSANQAPVGLRFFETMIRHFSRALLAFTLIATSPLAVAETVTIYRDEFGIPHIYAETAEAGLYAQGYAMAQDGLERTLQNYLRGLGRFSRAYGPGEKDENIRADAESLMWDHYGRAKKYYRNLHPEFRKHNAAFIAGINAFMHAYPEQVPKWWMEGDVDVYMPVAFSRQFIWGWPAGQAASDLRKIDLSPRYDVIFPYSNEMAIAPKRTEFGAAALIIDPHLSWYGRFRYWEVRIHAGDVHISGFATAGFPYVNLGHNRNVAWAHTTGGPDTGDVYELKLNPESPRQYLYDGEYRELTSRTVALEVKGEDGPRSLTFYYSHHGPIIARDGDRAYAAALAYAEEIGYLESKYHFMVAEDYKDVMDALKIMQIMPQNVMVADTNGDIYYQRTGRTPIRPDGYDFSKPVDGSTSASEWLGIHPTKDLVQVLNPPQGYMQNCNITPDVMMVDSPMTPDRYPSYIFNQPERYTHQRGSRATEALHNNDSFSVQEVLDLALDQKVYQYERWIAALLAADELHGVERGDVYKKALESLSNWDGVAHKNSAPALLYYYWRTALQELAGEEAARAIAKKVDNYLLLFDSPNEPVILAEREQRLLPIAFRRAITLRNAGPAGDDAVFGDVFRAGRLDYNDPVSFPVGGGSLRSEGMATLRAIGFSAPRRDGTRWGVGGQTSTEVVIMTDPIQSYTQPPLGQSDHKDSPHFRDQAEKLLSEGKFKPSWFQKEDLLDGHVLSTQELEYVPN